MKDKDNSIEKLQCGKVEHLFGDKPKKCMYTKDHYTDEDRKALCDGCEEECEYAQKKEYDVCDFCDEKNTCVDPCCVKLVEKQEPITDIDFEQELYKAFGQVKDFTLGMQIAKRFYEMGKQHQVHVNKDFRERYKRIAGSEQFKKTHEGMSIGEVIPVEGEEPSIPDIVDEHFEEMLEDTIAKQFKVGDVVIYAASHIAYAGLYLLGNPNDLSIGYSNANEPYNIALRNCTVASEEEHKQFMRELESNGYKWNESSLRIEKKEEPVSEPNKELAEVYLDVFDKKFPILPSLSSKQLADYKNFLNKCQQILGLKYWGIHPTQARLFEKLSLLWAAWGAEHLQGIGRQDEKEQDIPVSEDLGEYINELSKQFPEVSFAKLSRIAVRVAKWQKQKTLDKVCNFLEMLGQGFTITDEITHNTYNVEQLIIDFKTYMED